jgi:hypothetical protein
LGVWLGLLTAATAPALGQERNSGPVIKFPVRAEEPGVGMPQVPLEELQPGVRDNVRRVIERPTLVSPGPAESFYCQPAMYLWLLDHPVQAVRLWHVLGAQVTHVQEQKNGWFVWQDGKGSEVRWTTALGTAEVRVWYAEGRVKGSLLLPMAHVRAVMVLRHRAGKDRNGRVGVRHQAQLYLAADSRVLNLAGRILGASVPHLADQFMSQFEMFFGALAWSLDDDPARAVRLFQQIGQPVPAGAVTPRPGKANKSGDV